MRLYNSDELEFNHLGICSLNEYLSCSVTEELNGSYELEMTYHMDSKAFPEILLRRIIYCKPNPYSQEEPFRIYAISTPINRIITINAAHVSYDLSGYPVEPFVANSAQETISLMKSRSLISNPFNFYTDISKEGHLNVEYPRSIRNIMGNEFMELYEPEMEYRKFDIYFRQRRGSNNGVEIRYGKNLTDLQQDENIDNVYTAVYPFWYKSEIDENGEETEKVLVTIPNKVVPTLVSYQHVNILTYDLTNEFDERPTADDLINAANELIVSEKLGIPTLSMTIDFNQLSSSAEYSQYALLDKVMLGDTITVKFEEANIEAEVKCIATTYNPATNRYTSIELGDARRTLGDNIVDSNKNLNDKIDDSNEHNKSYFQKAMEELTNAITGNNGGYVRFNPPKNPSEILIMDTPDPTTAVVVWRWNKSGLGVSTTGYNGPFLGIGVNGKLVINEGTAHKFVASLIKGGMLESINGKSWINMDSGTFNLGGKITFDGRNFNIDLSSEDLPTKNDLNTAVNKIQTKINALEGSISTKVSQGDFLTLETKMSAAEQAISAKVNKGDFTKLEAKMSAAEGAISTKVSQGDYSTLFNQNAESFNFNIGNSNMNVSLNKNGIDVNNGAINVTNSNGVTVIDGSSNIFKIHAILELNLDAGSNLNYIYRVKHNLGYVPAYVAYEVDSQSAMGITNTLIPAMGVASTNYGVFGFATIIRVNADYNDIVINFLRVDDSYYRNFRVKIFVYKERLL